MIFCLLAAQSQCDSSWHKHVPLFVLNWKGEGFGEHPMGTFGWGQEMVVGVLSLGAQVPLQVNPAPCRNITATSWKIKIIHWLKHRSSLWIIIFIPQLDSWSWCWSWCWSRAEMWGSMYSMWSGPSSPSSPPQEEVSGGGERACSGWAGQTLLVTGQQDKLFTTLLVKWSRQTAAAHREGLSVFMSLLQF